GWVAAKTGKPYVVQVWGTDVELARRAPWLADRVLRGARSVIAASTELASAAQELGASEVRVIPSGVDLPDEVGQEAVPPEDLVVDQQTGLVVRPRDPPALRAALDRLLADRVLRRRLGAAGRERARRDFSWQAVTDATLDAYAGAVGTMGR